MANVKKIVAQGATGQTVYSIIKRESDGYLLSSVDGTFINNPASPYEYLTEHSTIKGQYEVLESRSVWTDGKYIVAAYKQVGGSANPTVDSPPMAGGEIMIKDDLEIVLDTALSNATYGLSALNTHLVTIQGKTDNLPADPASNTQVNTRLATSTYIAPDNTSIAAIKVITDKFLFDVNNFVKSIQQGAVTLTSAYNAAMTAASSGAAAQEIWTYATRTLTSGSSIAADIIAGGVAKEVTSEEIRIKADMGRV